MRDQQAPLVSNSTSELPDAMQLIDQPAELRALWERDGVLYFRQAVDPDAIAQVRQHYIERLQELGLVAEGADAPIWTGLEQVDGKAATKVPDTIWQDLVHHPSFDRPIRAFLGEAPAWVPIIVHRSAPPLPGKMPDPFAGRHQDGVFNAGIDFVTCWVPLMDIDETVGGLAVVPGAHNQSFYDQKPGELPGQAGAIAAGRIPDELWVRPDFKAGDILMFHAMTPHAGLGNLSDRFRLSIDVRYVRSSDPRPIVGWVGDFNGKVVEISEEEGGRSQLCVDTDTMVRGPKGNRVEGEELGAILFKGAHVIAVPDREGHARLVRSVSRKYVDVPAAFFSELPADWVS